MVCAGSGSDGQTTTEDRHHQLGKSGPHTKSVDDIQIIIMYLVCCWYSHTDIDDLFTVNCELRPVAHEWKNIGLALRLQPHHVLSTIEKNHTDVKDRLLNVLTEWLNKAYNTTRFGNPTWQMLVAAVAHPAGGNNPALAQHIASTYNGECVLLHVYSSLVFIHMPNQ